MAKNKDINISPSKGISIIIKNEFQPPPPIKPKKKRRYKRINILPKEPAPIMQGSTGDTSYIKAQPGRFSLWRDTTTATPVLTLAQATSQGFIPNMQLPAPPQQQALPAPPPLPALPPPPPPQQQQQLLMPPPFSLNFSDYMRSMMQQEFVGKQAPRIEDLTDMTDPFYLALPEDKKEAYKDAQLEDVAKSIDDTGVKAIEDAENNDFYKNQLDPATQTSTKEKSALIAIEQKLKNVRAGDIKGLGTKDVKALKDPRYPQNKIYITVYKEGLSIQQEAINKRITELDTIIATKTGNSKARAETERITRNDDLKKIEELNNKLRQEKKRIKKFLK
jgi:hypothetical protein